MKRGEMWWAESPDDGRRPVLILTRSSAIDVMHSVTCIPATRTIRGLDSEVLLDEDDGMPSECALSFDNVNRVPKSLLTQHICTLGAERMHEACRALRFASGC